MSEIILGTKFDPNNDGSTPIDKEFFYNVIDKILYQKSQGNLTPQLLEEYFKFLRIAFLPQSPQANP